MIGPLSVQPDLLLATTLGTTSSQTADRIHDVSYGYNFLFFLWFFFCIVFQFLFVWRECLVHQVPIVLTVLSFRFSGLCLMVVNATIHFHGQASPAGVWSFLRLPLNPSRGKKKINKYFHEIFTEAYQIYYHSHETNFCVIDTAENKPPPYRGTLPLPSSH